MSWTHSGSNRSSIFETFHTPSFGDDDLNLQQAASHTLANAKSDLVDDADEVRVDDDNDVECVPADEESMTTLWMSCSPGRDSPGQNEEEEEEEEEEDDDDDDEDDSLPLSCFQTSKTANKQSSAATKSKKTGKTAKKQKKKEKDRDAPKKPMSAYSLFFRDTQSSIKSQNPQATFGDVSRIVASMWDSLDTQEKDKYNSQSEQAKQVYSKTLEEYKAGKKTTQTQPKVLSAKTKTNHKSKQVLDKDSDNEKHVKKKYHHKVEDSSDEDFVIVEKKHRPQPKHLSDSDQSSEEEEKVKQSLPRCTRSNCNNIAVNDVRWDFDFCSVDCVVSHCKDIFTAWVASSRSVKVE